MTNQSKPKFTFAAIVSVFLLLCSCTSVLQRKQTVDAATALFQTEQQLNAKVIRVVDGDTVVVMDQSSATSRVRLKGIDAPETSQAFGPEAKARLTELSLNKDVQIYWSKKDPYGRVVGKLMIGTEDLCLKMLQSGLAWHYKQYQLEQSSQDLIDYSQAEKEARAAKRGLWNSDVPAIPPWQYRHQQPPRKPMSDNDDNGNDPKNGRLFSHNLTSCYAALMVF
jgi:endonuclease YncB( thermonuclease family)